MKKSLLLLFFSIINIHAFQYDSAAQALQQGQFNEAYEKLKPLMTENPDQADVLYDAGVAAYNMQKYAQARTYFLRSAEYADNDNLKSQAYFNAGNTSVALKDLHKALEYYDSVLSIDAKNEYALHNKNRVKEMLDQQKKDDKNQESKDQKQQDNDKNQQQDKDKNQQDQSQQNDQNQQDEKNNQQNDQQQKKDQQQNQSNNNDQQDQENNDSQSNKSNSSQKQSDQKERGDSSNNSNSDARKEQRDKKKDATNSNNDEQRNRDHQSQDKSDDTQNKSNRQQSQNHKNAPEEKQDQQIKSHASSSNVPLDEGKEQEEVGQLDQKLQDPWLINILQQQENKDKATNKQLMEAKIRQSGGKNGQNSW